MRSISVVIALLLGVGGAQAADTTSTRLAETGAFLLGHASRCSVSAARVSRAAAVIRNMITAAADDENEERAATSRFAEVFLAAAGSRRIGDGWTPPCSAVVTQFERLEQHHRQAGLN
jgi:hypothetical protein